MSGEKKSNPSDFSWGNKICTGHTNASYGKGNGKYREKKSYVQTKTFDPPSHSIFGFYNSCVLLYVII